MDKAAVLDAIRAGLRRELAALTHVTELAFDEATGEGSQPDDDQDTSGLEASYIAGAQAERLAQLRSLVQFYAELRAASADPDDGVVPGSLVRLREDGREWWAYVAPKGGGTTVQVGGDEVAVLSAESPLGRALVGSTQDDEIEVETPRSSRAIEILSVG